MKNTLLSGFILLLLIFTTNYAEAQKTQYHLIFLKNGEKVKGILLEVYPEGDVKVQTAAGDVLRIKSEEVEKIVMQGPDDIKPPQKERTSEIVKSEKEVTETLPRSKFLPQGYFLIPQLGMSSHSLSNTLDLSLRFVNGYQFNEYFSLGLGMQVTNYSWSLDTTGQGIVYASVFVDGRMYFPYKRVHPLVSIQGGYSFGNNNSFIRPPRSNGEFLPVSVKGGTFMGLGTGVRIFATHVLSFIGETSFTLQEMKGRIYEDDSDSYTIDRKAIPAFTIRFGVNITMDRGK